MFFRLTGALKRRFIGEIQRYWSYHPKFRDYLKVQGKFSFQERPQHSIIVKNSGGSPVRLSSDNYVGMVYSHCYLSKTRTKPGLAVEWVREDLGALRANNNIFPSPQGFYYIEIVEGSQGGFAFYVDPLLQLEGETPSQVSFTNFQLSQTPLKNSLRVFEYPSGYQLIEDTDFTLDTDVSGDLTGGLTLSKPLGSGRYIQVDYLYPVESRGPFPLREMHANNKAIPGVVLAFGRRVEAGDQMVVCVQKNRQPASLEYGGHWELGLEVDIMSRDIHSQEILADETALYLSTTLRSHLSSGGIEILEVSLGGESEEIYDENGDDYFYNASISLSVRTHWSVHVPLTAYLRSVSPISRTESRELSSLPEDQLKGHYGRIQILDHLGLEAIRDPFWSGQKGTFEVIS